MIVLAYGVPGAGKSTLLHDLVRQQAHAQRFFINAHSLEWHPESAHWRGAPPPGMTVCEGPESLLQLQEDKELPDAGVHVCLNCEASAVVRTAVAKGWSTYVDDEIDLIARRAGWEQSPLRSIVHQGRHLQNEEGEFTEVHLYGACRRPQNLHTDLTDLADEFYVFRLKGGNTRKRLQMDSLIEDDAEWERVREQADFAFKFSGKKGDLWLTIPPLGRGEHRRK